MSKVTPTAPPPKMRLVRHSVPPVAIPYKPISRTLTPTYPGPRSLHTKKQAKILNVKCRERERSVSLCSGMSCTARLSDRGDRAVQYRKTL